MIAAGAKLNHRDTEKRTALHRSVMNGNTRLVKRLYARGARADYRDDEGARALDIAISRQFTNIAKILVNLNYGEILTIFSLLKVSSNRIMM